MTFKPLFKFFPGKNLLKVVIVLMNQRAITSGMFSYLLSLTFVTS